MSKKKKTKNKGKTAEKEKQEEKQDVGDEEEACCRSRATPRQ